MTVEIDHNAIALQIKTTLTAQGVQRSSVTDARPDENEKDIMVAWKRPNAPAERKAETFIMCFTNAASAKYAQNLLEATIRDNNVRKHGAADLGPDVPDAKPGVSSHGGGFIRHSRTFDVC